mmetsp:Transcript_7433/g.13441  ORF Transcript_7433/g.13441 Transcript_7433/m.13441 type:complete len:271 (-) Transcript_7433:58-870(-)
MGSEDLEDVGILVGGPAAASCTFCRISSVSMTVEVSDVKPRNLLISSSVISSEESSSSSSFSSEESSFSFSSLSSSLPLPLSLSSLSLSLSLALSLSLSLSGSSLIFSKIFSSCGKLPCLTIRSASSMTRYFKAEKSARCSCSLELISSQRRPGVATMISGQVLRTRVCFSAARPPTREATRKMVTVGRATDGVSFFFFPFFFFFFLLGLSGLRASRRASSGTFTYSCSSFCTCRASSRVGAKMSALRAFELLALALARSERMPARTLTP